MFHVKQSENLIMHTEQQQQIINSLEPKHRRAIAKYGLADCLNIYQWVEAGNGSRSWDYSLHTNTKDSMANAGRAFANRANLI